MKRLAVAAVAALGALPALASADPGEGRAVPERVVASRPPVRPPAPWFGRARPAPLGLARQWRLGESVQEVAVATRRSIVVHGWNQLTVLDPADGSATAVIKLRTPPPSYDQPALFGLGERFLIRHRSGVAVFAERATKPMWDRGALCGLTPVIREVRRVGSTIYLLESTPDRSTLLAIDADTGACRWKQPTVAYDYPLDLMATATWVAARAGSEVAVHGARTGRRRFRWVGSRSFGVAASRRGVVVGVEGVGLRVLDPTSGAVVARLDDRSLGSGNHATVAWIGAITVAGEVAYVTTGGELHAWPIGAPRLRWRVRESLFYARASGRSLYGCDSAANLVVIDRLTGRERWRHGGGCRVVGVIEPPPGAAPLVVNHGRRLAGFTASRRQPMERAVITGVVTIDGRPADRLRVDVGRDVVVRTDRRGRFRAEVVGLGTVAVAVDLLEALRASGRPNVVGTFTAVELDGSGRYAVRINARGADPEL